MLQVVLAQVMFGYDLSSVAVNHLDRRDSRKYLSYVILHKREPRIESSPCARTLQRMAIVLRWSDLDCGTYRRLGECNVVLSQPEGSGMEVFVKAWIDFWNAFRCSSDGFIQEIDVNWYVTGLFKLLKFFSWALVRTRLPFHHDESTTTTLDYFTNNRKNLPLQVTWKRL